MFKIVPIDNNIFMVVRKNAFVEGSEFYTKLPIEAYGFIKVTVLGNNELGIALMNISDELSASSELTFLEEDAKEIVKQQLYSK